MLNSDETRDGTYIVKVRNRAEENTLEIHLSTQAPYEIPERLLVVQN